MVGIGLIGFGYWGPNLARNFAAQPDCELAAICETDPSRAQRATQSYRLARVTHDYQDLLDDPKIDAIVIATPVMSHFALAKQALLAGKDVLLSKPMTRTVAEAEELIELAARRQRVLAVDHTFLFTGAVTKIKEIVAAGAIGDIVYFDSVRINLGLFQHDVNVLYDLAPHDLSILCHLIPDQPLALRALGARPGNGALESLAYLHLEYANRVIAHLHLSWLAPVKIRRTLIVGTKRMIVYDDMEPSEKVKVYDKSVVFKPAADAAYKLYVDYRTGDMVAPKLVHKEALEAEAEHFLCCVRERSQPRVDGPAGLQVVRLLEAAALSLAQQGARVELQAPAAPPATERGRDGCPVHEDRARSNPRQGRPLLRLR